MKIIKILKGHINSVLCILAISNDFLISASADTTIKIWHLVSGQCLATLYGHLGFVNSLQFSNNILYSCSHDSTIRAWNLNNFKIQECIRIFKGHKSFVTSIQLYSDNYIISASNDSTIKVWEIISGLNIKNLTGHTDSITCLKIKNDLLFSSSWDKTVKIWNIFSEQVIRSFVGDSSINSILIFSNETLISGDWQGFIKIWDIKNGKCVHKFKAHKNRITCIENFSIE